MNTWHPCGKLPRMYKSTYPDCMESARLLVYVANCSSWDRPQRVGRVAFGNVRIFTKTHSVLWKAEGFTGDWKITYWMEAPKPPKRKK